MLNKTQQAFDIPLPSPASDRRWGSDLIAELIRNLDIPFIVLTPGASFRGLHDSLVNHLGNSNPPMRVVLHEEHAVAIAHGYAKVTGKPVAAVVHSNVGLMHATMAIFDAWADRVPVLVLGATGPLDAAKRRPWIDWLHTSQDQAAMIRHYVKWDAQPSSVPATLEAITRAWRTIQTLPHGPAYVSMDAEVQEGEVLEPVALPDLSRHQPPAPPVASALAMNQLVETLQQAKRPLILMGRMGRGEPAWQARIQLAERLGAAVLTDLKAAASFPNEHPQHAAAAGTFMGDDAKQVLAQADVVLSLDWVDLGGTLKQAFGEQVSATVIQVSMDHHIHNGWSMDHQGLPVADQFLACDPDEVVQQLNDALTVSGKTPWTEPQAPLALLSPMPDGPMTVQRLAHHLWLALDGQPACLARTPLSWNGDFWPVRHPLDYLGTDGGGGVGSGPGMAVGAAMALAGTDRLPISMLGDGDYLMGVNAIWTAAKYQIPGLIIVCNNRSFYNDEVHQERVARQREREVANKWVGQRLDDPAPDLAGLARAQGLIGMGPISDDESLQQALKSAIASVNEGKFVVLDVHVASGYSPSMTSGLTKN